MPHQRDSRLPDEKLPKRFERTRAQANEEKDRQEQARKEKWANRVREEAGSALPDGSQPNDVPEQSGDSGGPDLRLSDSDGDPAPSKDSEMDSDETDPTEIDINDAEGLRTKLDKKRKKRSRLKDRLQKLEEKVEELETELAEAKAQQVQAIRDNVSKGDFDRVTTQVGRLMELWEQSEAEKNRLRRRLRECEQRIEDLESKGMANGQSVQNTNGAEPVVSPPGKASGRKTSEQMRFERKKNGEKKKIARKGSVEVEVPKFTPV